MDLQVVSGDRSYGGPSATRVAATQPPAQDGAAPSASASSTADDSVMLTVSLAGTRRSYGYRMPDDAVLAAAITSITDAPGASLGSQVLHLPETSSALLAR